MLHIIQVCYIYCLQIQVCYIYAMSTHICTCMYVYMYIHVSTHTDTHTHTTHTTHTHTHVKRRSAQPYRDLSYRMCSLTIECVLLLQVKRRSALPYRDLSLVPDPSSIDPTLMNEAKVALRRALKMEGVGIMVLFFLLSSTEREDILL